MSICYIKGLVYGKKADQRSWKYLQLLFEEIFNQSQNPLKGENHELTGKIERLQRGYGKKGSQRST